MYDCLSRKRIALALAGFLSHTLNTNCIILPDIGGSIEEFTTSVSSFINKCIYDVIPIVTVSTYPNQKQWITGNICTKG
jgi:hypothetical protein